MTRNYDTWNLWLLKRHFYCCNTDLKVHWSTGELWHSWTCTTSESLRNCAQIQLITDSSKAWTVSDLNYKWAFDDVWKLLWINPNGYFVYMCPFTPQITSNTLGVRAKVANERSEMHKKNEKTWTTMQNSTMQRVCMCVNVPVFLFCFPPTGLRCLDNHRPCENGGVCIESTCM